MDTPTARVITQPRILSFLHILTFSPSRPPFLRISRSLHLIYFLVRWNSVFHGGRKRERKREWNEKGCISDPEDRISFFFFFFRKLAFSKNRSRLGESNVGWWNGYLSGFFMPFLLCDIFFIFLLLLLLFFFFGGYFILVSTCRRWRKLKFRSDEKLGRPSERFYLFGWPWKMSSWPFHAFNPTRPN